MSLVPDGELIPEVLATDRSNALALEPYRSTPIRTSGRPDTGHYPLAPAFKVSDMKPASFTAEELLAHCRPSGVGRVNLIQMSYYTFDNAYMLDMIKLYPDRFVGTAILDPFQEKLGQAMLDLRPKGVVAFRIQPQYSKLPPERWLEPEGYEEMFQTSAKGGQALSCLIDSKGFAEVDRMCRKHPEALVIIDHLGRIGIDGTIRQEDVDALCALAKHPKILIKVGAFYALGKKVPPYLDLGPLIQSVVQAFGRSRRLYVGKRFARFRSSRTSMTRAWPSFATVSIS